MRSFDIRVALAVSAIGIGVVTQVASMPLRARSAEHSKQADTTGQHMNGEQGSADTMATPRQALLLELFTSEGCSSCPPADALLERLDRTQPVQGAELIVLSEHVDYWNRLGWTDPFSSALFSQRQQDYVAALRVEGPFTPQLLIDGKESVVGSDERAAKNAAQRAVAERKAEVRIVEQKGAAQKDFAVSVEGAARGALVVVALASEAETSQVPRGENSGRVLRHVGVVRTLQTVGKIDAQGAFAKDIRLPFPVAGKGRAVAFVQDPVTRRILGVAQVRF
jgi:hypothetical protein